MLAAFPASRFVDPAGRAIFTKVERGAGGMLGRELTWQTAVGAIVWIGRRSFYLPLFFWRGLR
jgi:hypothetical protein